MKVFYLKYSYFIKCNNNNNKWLNPSFTWVENELPSEENKCSTHQKCGKVKVVCNLVGVWSHTMVVSQLAPQFICCWSTVALYFVVLVANKQFIRSQKGLSNAAIMTGDIIQTAVIFTLHRVVFLQCLSVGKVAEAPLCRLLCLDAVTSWWRPRHYPYYRHQHRHVYLYPPRHRHCHLAKNKIATLQSKQTHNFYSNYRKHLFFCPIHIISYFSIITSWNPFCGKFFAY